MNNTTLWDSVYKTDPAHTKKFQKAGGFSGTAIKPIYLMHKATEIFGVCGIGWGWNELENKVVGGVWCSKVQLWFIYNNQKGHVEQWGQTTMEGKNSKGAFVDEEAPKKAVTDAVTKCLSYLGFAGDVHMGLFDDSKYVDERVKEEKAETAISKKKRFAAIKEAIANSNDPATTWHENMDEINGFLEADKQFYDDLVQAGKHRKEQLAQEVAMRTGMPDGFNGVHQ